LSRARVHINLHDGNFVLLKVNNTVTEALIDTGANNSFVSASFVRRLRLYQNVRNARSCSRLFTAGGKPMIVRGVIVLSLNINGLIIPFCFHVVEYLHHQMLLGIDFLTKIRTNIDFSDGKITFNDGLAEATLNKHSDSLLKTVEAVLISPKIRGTNSYVYPTLLYSKTFCN